MRPVATSAVATCQWCVLDNIDECAVDNGNCSENATCINFSGGYNCECLDGFLGDGFNCTGICAIICLLLVIQQCTWFAITTANSISTRTELPIDYQKYVIDDYVSGPDSCAKFGVNPSMRARGQMGEI